jgi:hypothetical protein
LRVAPIIKSPNHQIIKLSNLKKAMSKKRLKPAPARNLNRATIQNQPAPPPRPADPAARATAALTAALAQVDALAAARYDRKLSISRLLGVSRELKELIKVTSAYEL